MVKRQEIMDVSDVIALEKQIEAAGTPLKDLMKTAGESVASFITEEISPEHPVLVFCGKGNNGGDGWVVAHTLAQAGWEVSLFTPLTPENIVAQPTKDTVDEYYEAAPDGCLPFSIVVDPDEAAIKAQLTKNPVIVDAILGTGFVHDSVREPFAGWIRAINEARATAGCRVIAIDSPSGLNAQTGAAADPCVIADDTITMLANKTGLALSEAAAHTGTVHVSLLI